LYTYRDILAHKYTASRHKRKEIGNKQSFDEILNMGEFKLFIMGETGASCHMGSCQKGYIKETLLN